MAKYCRHCGKKLKKGAIKCPRCGNYIPDVSVDIEPVPAETAPPTIIVLFLLILGIAIGISAVFILFKYGPLKDKNTSDDGFRGELFMQKDKGQNQRNDNTQLINRRDLGYPAHLKCLVIAQPGCAGCKAGKDQENPAALTDLAETFLCIRQKNYSPCHNKYNSCPDRGSQIGIDAFDTNFGKDRS